MREIRGKKALVTGAASGIGRAIALRLAQEGVDLFLVDIDEAGLAAVVAEAREAGVEVIGRRCDVGQPREVSAAVADLLDRWGGVDILVNNAGITYYGRTDEMSAEHWDRLLRMNLLVAHPVHARAAAVAAGAAARPTCSTSAACSAWSACRS